MSPVGTVELIYRDPSVADGTVVGSIEVFDTSMLLVAREVLRSGEPIAVELARGRYLAIASRVSQQPVQRSFEVHGRLLVDMSHPDHDRDARTDLSGADWVAGWRHAGSGWEPAHDLIVGDGTVSLVDPSATSVALQVGGRDGASTVVVPAATPVLLAPAAAGPRVALAPGVESTLLELLHCGDITAARVVAAHALGDESLAGAGPFREIVVGYFLLRTGDGRLRDWVSATVWNQPLSVDAAVLTAWAEMRSPGPDREFVRGELLRAAGTGLPVVGFGLRLLGHGLSLLGDDPRAVRAITALRPFQLALRDTALTGFAGDPTDPAGTQVQPARAVPVRHVRAGLPSGGPAVDLPPTGGEVVLGAVAAALETLPGRGFGPHSGTVRGGEGDAVVTTWVMPSSAGPADTFDVRLSLDGDAAARASRGSTAVLDVGAGAFRLAVVGEAGAATFTSVPAGRWRISLRRRLEPDRNVGPGYAMPPVSRDLVLAAAPFEAGREVARAVVPEAGTIFVMRTAGGDAFELEVVAPAGARPTFVAVTYDSLVGDGVVLIPLNPAAYGRASGVARLDGFVLDRPWSITAPMPATDLTRWSPRVVTAAVRAANAGTRMAWRLIAATAVQPYPDAIEDGLSHDR